MRVCTTIAEARRAATVLARPVGFVPTMGALHAGHESLIARSAAECAATVASLFVNPLQFAPGEDFARYPRDFENDVRLFEQRGVDALFAPAQTEMIPADASCTVDPGPLGAALEGERRPGHFRGVATIVLKLLEIVRPDRAYFGQKDAQQLAVVRRMAADFNLPVEVVACPTVREPDGLALSSRNRYLSSEERQAAPGLWRALRFVADAARGGATDVPAILRGAAAELGSLRADYLAVVDPAAFVPLRELPRDAELLAVGAAFCGSTRLIDNLSLRTP